MTNDKITPDHLVRKAVVYVRQSTAEQVRSNRESQKRQYALADRARAMGWHSVEVIDEDLGCSGATSAGRTGFARLVASICMKEVGAVFSLEASRLARNNRDWYQLLDFCTLVGTLIVDFDGVYDPRLLNDRLLLGLKGTMSEFELGLIKLRAHEALRQMARRGELLTNVPIGFVRSFDNRCEKDPDLRIQHALQLVFEKFLQSGSVRQTLLWFRQEGVALPALAIGSGGQRITWKLPVYNSVMKILTNPIYAGAYAYGRTYTRTTVKGTVAVKARGCRRSQEEWEVLIPNHHDGYITWQTYLRNQEQIRENAKMKGSFSRGPAQAGTSLLAGLLRCGRCGRKLHVCYSGKDGKVPRYGCRGASVNHGTDKCISFGGIAVDRAVEREIIKALEPAAVEAAMSSLVALQEETDEHRRALELALVQAKYEADRAKRQYDAVEPENRLVASELERRWNRALAEVDSVQQRLQQVPALRKEVTSIERQQLLSLAHDFPAIWNHPETDMRIKKRLLRALVEEIIADVNEEEARVSLVIRWAGGCHTRLLVRKNHTGQHRHATSTDVVEITKELAQVIPDRDIASVLNRLGMRTGKGNTWTEARVRALRNDRHIPAFSPEMAEARPWLTMQEAASQLKISAMTVRHLILDGTLPARQIAPCAPWMIERSTLASESVQQAVESIHKGRRRPLNGPAGQQELDLEPM